jgi:hypothetical protein
LNFIQLVQSLVSELGIGGANTSTAPTTVLGQTGQLGNAVNWIRQANNDINLLHPDWNFLVVDYTEDLTVGSRVVPAHSGSEAVKQWDRSSFYLERDTANAVQLEWMEWREFRSVLLPGAGIRPNSRPTTFTVKRDNSLLLDNPPDVTYELTAEFWRRPTLLGSDADVPLMPEDFHRLIVVTAGIKYANKESAVEIIQGMEAEYLTLLEGLKADQLPMHEFHRMGAADLDLVMDIPGYADDLRG